MDGLLWGSELRLWASYRVVVPFNQIEYGFGHIVIRSPYTPYSVYLKGTIRGCGNVRTAGKRLPYLQ